MAGSYGILFSIQLTHTFYQDERCRDFSLIPTASCEKLLRDHGLLIRYDEDGLKVLFEHTGTEKKVLRKIEHPVRFTFLLTLKDLNFRNFTALGEVNKDFPGRTIFYFNNLDKTSGEIDFELVDGKMSLISDTPVGASDAAQLLPLRFHIPVDPEVDNEIEIYRREAGGNKVKIFSQEIDNGQSMLPMDLSSFPAGKYQCAYLGSNPRRQELYLDPALLSRNIFGIAEIYKDADAIDYDHPADYFIEFEAKKIVWSYYISFRETTAVPELRIEVAKKKNSQSSSNSVTVSFNDVPETEQSEQEKAIITSLPLATRLFKSSGVLQVSDLGLPLVIKLKKTIKYEGEPKHEFITLPQVSSRSLSPEIFLTI